MLKIIVFGIIFCYNIIELNVQGDFMRVKNEQRLNFVYDFILDFQKNYGKSPTYRQIGEGCGISSLGSVTLIVKDLEKRGLLTLNEGWNKIDVKDKFSIGQTKPVSIIGNCRCGEPALSYENIYSTVLLPTEIFGEGELFILKANGRSMIERGIFDGDLMVVKSCNTAENGQVVIARVNGEESTAKILVKENGKIYLAPANSEKDELGNKIYNNIYPVGDWDIIGIVQMVIHAPDKKVF